MLILLGRQWPSWLSAVPSRLPRSPPLAETPPSAHSPLHPTTYLFSVRSLVCPSNTLLTPEFLGFFSSHLVSEHVPISPALKQPSLTPHPRFPALIPTLAEATHPHSLQLPSLSRRVFPGTVLWVRGQAQGRAVSLLDLSCRQPSHLQCEAGGPLVATGTQEATPTGGCPRTIAARSSPGPCSLTGPAWWSCSSHTEFGSVGG